MGKILDEIKKIAEEKKEAGKKFEISSFRKSRIKSLERKYEEGDLNKDEMIAELRKEFSYHLDGDYERIGEAIR